MASWRPALCGGVELAGGQLAQDEVGCGFYGDLFRPPGRHLGVGEPLIGPGDLDWFEEDLLAAWWDEAARTDAAVISPDARTLGTRVPQKVQSALRALSGSRFFAGLSERALMGDLRQVRDYFTNPAIRQQARERVGKAIGRDTHVVVGHSLGSVVAYEALCANPEWPVWMLVTIGSPLGIPNLIFDRLDPAPLAAGGTGLRGRWPGPGRRWANIADEGDVVALVKDLRSSEYDQPVSAATIPPTTNDKYALPPAICTVSTSTEKMPPPTIPPIPIDTSAASPRLPGTGFP